MEKIPIKYRTWYQGEPPRPIRLQIPGWAGEQNKHTDGDVPQAWHCTPFVEASTYGLELVYNFDTECHVKYVDGELKFIGDFSQEKHKIVPQISLPPFSTFAPGHFGMSSCADIMVPEGHILRLEPHPRYYTDETHTTPLCIPGHLATAWWPKIFFVVFKNPMPGQTYIFRKGEPYAQILVLPRKVQYDIEPMTATEANRRNNIDDIIVKYGKIFSTNDWHDNLGHNFNDKYKVLNNVFTKSGKDGVIKFLDQVSKNLHSKVQRKFKGRLFMRKKNEGLQN